MEAASHYANELDDLAVITSMLQDLAHENLAIAVDVNGRPGVALAPSVAARIHFLIRESARRSMALSNQAERENER